MMKRIRQTVMILAIVLCILLPVSAGRNVKVGLYPLGRFSYLDGNNKENGYSVEYVDHLATLAGWDVRFVMLDNQYDAITALQDGKVDMMAPMEQSESSPFSFPSCPFGIDYDGIYTLEGRNDLSYGDEEALTSLTIGMVDGSESGKRFLQEHGTSPKPVSYPDHDALLSALRQHDVDAILTDALSVDGSLKVLACSSPFPIYMAVGKGNPTLLQELDSALATVKRSNPSYEAELAERYFPFRQQPEGEASFVSFLSRHKVLLTIIGVFLLCILLFLFLLLHIRKTEHLLVGNKVRELKDANARATRANETKGRFLSLMSHEIRTPLNAIIGLATVAKNDVEDPTKMTDYLGKIDESSKSLLSIINDMLDISAIETNTMKLNHERFSIRELLSPIIIIAYHQCSQKGITFNAHYRGDGNEYFRGDSLHINQILQNLLSNAVRFTGKGGAIDFIISIVSHQKAKETFRFTVRDNGEGISEEMTKSLFKPFDQARLNAASPEAGSSLGLSITKSLVELMDGTISVQSALAKGSTFTVDLPLDLSLDQPPLPIEVKGRISLRRSQK